MLSLTRNKHYETHVHSHDAYFYFLILGSFSYSFSTERHLWAAQPRYIESCKRCIGAIAPCQRWHYREPPSLPTSRSLCPHRGAIAAKTIRLLSHVPYGVQFRHFSLSLGHVQFHSKFLLRAFVTCSANWLRKKNIFISEEAKIFG